MPNVSWTKQIKAMVLRKLIHTKHLINNNHGTFIKNKNDELQYLFEHGWRVEVKSWV